jgi:protein-S-isoprenylcysteine O-methyltransferase Ste14
MANQVSIISVLPMILFVSMLIINQILMSFARTQVGSVLTIRTNNLKKAAQKIMPTNYFIALLIMSIVLHFIFPIRKIIFPPVTYLGLLLILFGAILNLWTDYLFKQKKTTVKPYLNPTELIMDGPFSLSRHPMYLGMASILLGVALNHGTISTFITPALFIILMEVLFIPFEEKNLVNVFGGEYLSYKQKVRRWI